MRSPIDGTVVSVEVGQGATVTAGGTAFEIAGLDSYQVQTEVPVTDLPMLKTGQRASVQADGLASPLTGSVISIGLTPDTSNSPVTYPVTIGLTGQPAGLHPNGFASVVISTGHSRGVSVPTSAVHYTKHGATVTVYAAGRARAVKVIVGTKGPVRTRITAGLMAGQQVVLAILGQPLPSNNLNQGPGFGSAIIPAGRSVRLQLALTVSGPAPGVRPGPAEALPSGAAARTRARRARPHAGPGSAAGHPGSAAGHPSPAAGGADSAVGRAG